jgi:hypothetical protein
MYIIYQIIIIIGMLLWSIYWNLINIMHESIPGVTIPPPREHTRAFDLTGYDSAQLIEEVCRDTTRRLMHSPWASWEWKMPHPGDDECIS